MGLAPREPAVAVFVDDDVKEHAKMTLDSRILHGGCSDHSSLPSERSDGSEEGGAEGEEGERNVFLHRILFTRVK